jgi:Ca2+-binding EF-hand superfamily protein
MTERAIEKGEKRAHFNENCFHVKTPFFDHKIKTLFTRFDFDHNGKIEKNDFENWANNLSRAGNLSEEKAEILRQSINQIWNVYFLPADTNNDGSVEYLELLDHMKAVREFK